VVPASAYAFCEEVTRREARNFYYGIRLLPRDKRLAMCAVYALARRIDDIGDGPVQVTGRRYAAPSAPPATPLGSAPATVDTNETDGKLARLRALALVREQVSAPLPPVDDPVLVAVHDAAGHLPLPLDAFLDLADGVEMDVRGSSYATFDELVDYCRRVAGSIGRLSVAIFGVGDLAAALPLADRLGVALQLTNILRDVREDGANGRHYLPADDLDRFGCQYAPDGRLAGPIEQIGGLVRFQADRAEAAFADGLRLLPLLDWRSAACCAAMVGIYHRLLTEIRRCPEVVLERRVSLTGWEKAGIAIRSLVGQPPRPSWNGTSGDLS
jgi:15-cis-phytoene synthase